MVASSPMLDADHAPAGPDRSLLAATRAAHTSGSVGEALDRRPHVALAIGALHGVSGGAERVVADTANGLHARGYQVTVLTYQDRSGPSFYPLDFGIRRLDGRIRHGDSPGVARAPLALARPLAQRHALAGGALWAAQYLPRVLRLLGLVRVARPDVVVGFLPSIFPYLAIAARMTRTPMIASIHNVPTRELGGDPTRWDQNPVDIAIRRRSLHWADAVTVLLPSFVDDLPAGVRPTTYVVPNMIHGFGSLRADVTEGRDNTVLAVGRLVAAKDHATLVRAWAGLEPRFPSWSLRIVGDGPLEDSLRDDIAQLGLRRVTIDPPTREIDAVYASAKLLVMPSIHEGFGLVTGEAMAAGLPVVGFADCEGTNELIVPGTNGLLVDPGHDRADSLARGLAELMGDHDLRARLAAGAPRSVERFSQTEVIDAWERVILDVHGRRGRHRGGA